MERITQETSVDQRKASTRILCAAALAAAFLGLVGCTTSRGVAYAAPFSLNGDEVYIGVRSDDCGIGGCIDYYLYVFEDGSVICRLFDEDKVRKTYRRQIGRDRFLSLKDQLIQEKFFSKPDEEPGLSHGRTASVSANFGEGRTHRQLACCAGTASSTPGEWPTVELIVQTAGATDWTNIKRRQGWSHRRP
jgi:hypothetical protein